MRQSKKIRYLILFIEHWVSLSLKFIGIFTVIAAIWAIQEPNLTLQKKSAISYIDMETFFKKVKERGIQNVEKSFYEELNEGRPFSALSWLSYVNDKNQDELNSCKSQIKSQKAQIKKRTQMTVEEVQEDVEKMAEARAGYGKRDETANLIDQKEHCTHYRIFDLKSFLTMKYGVDFNLFRVTGTHISFFEDPLYQLIKSFENKVALFGELGLNRSVVTILSVTNSGKLDARDVKVRFNFIEATMVETGGGRFGSLRPSWQVLEEPVLLEGGTISNSPPYGAEVSYGVIPAGTKKWIYVITSGNDLSDKAYFLEPPPYISRISPTIILVGVIILIIISGIMTILKIGSSRKSVGKLMRKRRTGRLQIRGKGLFYD